MNRILKVALAALLLVTLLLSTVACGMENMTGFTRLRDHLVSNGVYDGKVVVLDTPSERYARSRIDRLTRIALLSLR